MKHQLLAYLILMFMLLLGSGKTSKAQTTLSPGDLLLIEFNGNGTDGFTLMPLIDLLNGTQIHFTNYRWTGTAFNIAEDGNPSNGGK